MNLRVLITDWGTTDVKRQNENRQKKELPRLRETLVQFQTWCHRRAYKTHRAISPRWLGVVAGMGVLARKCVSRRGLRPELCGATPVTAEECLGCVCITEGTDHTR